MKLFRAFMSLFFVPISMYGQNVREYSLHFNIDDFCYSENDGFGHIDLRNGNTIVWGDTLEPALPCIGVNILVSVNDSYKDAFLKSNEVLVLSDVKIEPNSRPVPTNHVVSSFDRNATYECAVYPQKEIEYTGTHLMDGYKYLSFVVCPFRYETRNNRLFLKKDINIELQLSNEDNSLTENYEGPYNELGSNMRGLVETMVVNGGEMEMLYEKNSRRGAKSLISPSYKYIIVTNDTLRPIFEKLSHWKTIKGVRAKVITVAECCNLYPNVSPQLAIKTVLANYYSNGMTYTLLGGDTDVVPVQLCYLPSYTSDTTDTPADLYYACLDNCFSWDANGNQIYGEDTDNVDLAPEFIVTRASVSTVDEAEIFVNRIIEYESSPKMDGWTNKMLSCGNYLSQYYTKNGVQISDAQYQGEYVYENGVQNYWTGTLFELFDTYTDHANGAAYQATGEHLQTEMEKGYTFVDEFSHAWQNVWGWLEDWTKFTSTQAKALVNSGYTLISTISCYSNAFDKQSADYPDVSAFYTTSLSEDFLRNPNSGVLAYFGSSREGWVACSYLFDRKYYEFLLSGSDKKFGQAAMASKNAFLSMVPTSGYNRYRWLIMTLNPLGDPEMPVFTVTPQNMTNVNVSFSNGNLSVATGIEDCRVCVSSASDYGNSFYECYDSISSANFSGVNEDCFLCITKTGYIPYIARVGNSVFLQNETIKRDIKIFSGTTYAGRDVTTAKAQGPVVIEKGKVTVNSQGPVILKNSFEVKIGSELEIVP